MTEHDHYCEDMLGTLSAYIDRELSEEECRELVARIEDCEQCREILLSFKATRNGVARFADNEMMSESEAEECIRKCAQVLKSRMTGKNDGDR